MASDDDAGSMVGSSARQLCGPEVQRGAVDGFTLLLGIQSQSSRPQPQSAYEMAAAAVRHRRQAAHDALDLRRRNRQHLSVLAMWGVPDKANVWLDQFLELAPTQIVAETSRFIADFLTLADLSDEAAIRVIAILKVRLLKAGPT